MSERPLRLTWSDHVRDSQVHTEWHAPCGCAYHPEPCPHVHLCAEHWGHGNPDLDRLLEREHKACQVLDALDELRIGAMPADASPFIIQIQDEEPRHIAPEQATGWYDNMAKKIRDLGDWSRLRSAEAEQRKARAQVVELEAEVKEGNELLYTAELNLVDRGKRITTLESQTALADALLRAVETIDRRDRLFALKGVDRQLGMALTAYRAARVADGDWVE